MNFLYLRGLPLTSNVRAGDNSVRSLPSGRLQSQQPISLPQLFHFSQLKVLLSLHPFQILLVAWEKEGGGFRRTKNSSLLMSS